MRRRRFVATMGAAAVGLAARRPGLRGLTAQRGSASLADGLGVNMRLGDMTPDKLALARNTGFRWLRTDILWAQIEAQAGAFDFSAQAAALGRARQLGFRMLGILDYGHPIHTQGRGPATQAERSAFVTFAQHAESEIGGLVDAWEIWNEPNYKGFWAPSPNPADFAALVRDAARGIWAVNARRQIVAGGLANLDTAFLSAITPTLVEVARSGPLAGSVHPYRATPPETFAAELARVSLLDPHGRAWAAPGVPLWVTEWGYCRLRENLGGVGQAEMDARLPLVTAGLGVPVTILFELIDARAQQTECGHSYGLYETGSLLPHPAGIAVQQLLNRYGGQVVMEPGLLRGGSGWGLKTDGGELRWASALEPVAGSALISSLGDTLSVGNSKFWLDEAPKHQE
jgi:hypothetical protein